MLNALEGTPYRIPFLLIVATGMRRGEVLGLKWQDINWKTRTLIIERAIVQTRGLVTEKLPKSGKTRVVLLPVQLIKELQQHKAYHESMGYKTEWISINESGGHMTPCAICKGIENAQKKSGVKAGLHSWRHDQATMLLMAGVPAKIVSERLGHATINITQDLYAHVLPQMQAPAVDIIEAAWTKRIEEEIKAVDATKKGTQESE
jgi:integrase